MTLNGKIDAIKKLRELTSKMEIEKPTVNMVDGSYNIIVRKPCVGLKEAKDFVEAVMELAPKVYVEIKTVYILKRISKMGGAIEIPQVIIGYFGTYDKAVAKRDNIMLLKAYNYGSIWETEDDFLISCIEVQ